MFPWPQFCFFCQVTKHKPETAEPVMAWSRFSTFDRLDREANRLKSGGTLLIVFFKDGIEWVTFPLAYSATSDCLDQFLENWKSQNCRSWASLLSIYGTKNQYWILKPKYRCRKRYLEISVYFPLDLRPWWREVFSVIRIENLHKGILSCFVLL